MSKFLGFLLGIAVALVGPAMFGVLAADGGIKLNAKEMALAYGIGALIFWTVASYFAGAAALGAALTFGAMVYTVHWIPNRLTNFLNDVPGVTTGMIDGIKQYTLNGVVPILAVISLIFAIQSIVRSVQRRRRERAEADRLQREQEAAVQAQQMPEPPAPAYAVAGGDYQPDNRFGSNFGNSNYDDLFDDEPAQTPFTPRNQADEQTAQFRTAAVAGYSDERDGTREGEERGGDETVLVSTDSDETALVPGGEKNVADGTDLDGTVVAGSLPGGKRDEAAEGEGDETLEATTQVGGSEAASPQGGGSQGGVDEDATEQMPVGAQEAPTQQVPVASQEAPTRQVPVASEEASTRQMPVGAQEALTQQVPVAESVDSPAAGPRSDSAQGAGAQADGGEATQPVPVPEPEVAKPVAPRVAGGQQGGVAPEAAGGAQGGAPQAAAEVGESGGLQVASEEAAGAFWQGTSSTGAVKGAASVGGTREDDGGEVTQAVPVSRLGAGAPVAPQAPAYQAPAPHVAGPQASAPQIGGPEASAPQASVDGTTAPQASADRGFGAEGPAEVFDQEAESQGALGWGVQVNGGEVTQAVPMGRADVSEAGKPNASEAAKPQAPEASKPQVGLHRKEEVGQQYRERMDPPDVDDTGEFFVGSFESPTEQPPSRMELPGHFRPAGT